MIKINGFAIGNKVESFVFDDFKDKINIIHSDDNNKGKTILSQGVFYALGNTPIFPAGFENYEEYYFVVQLEIDGRILNICRKKDFFIVNDGKISSFDSVNDFKRYFDSNILSLPYILKNGAKQKAGLELFYEMVFLPQDKRTTSNIINKGRYNKEDFYEFLYSFMNCNDESNPELIEKYKNEILELDQSRKVLKKQSSLLKSKSIEASFATYTASKTRIDNKLKLIEKCRDSISELVNSKNRLLNKITKNELLFKELTSLNYNLEAGKLVCAECHSDKIYFESKQEAIIFDISDNDTRSQIKDIISDRIQVCREDINDIDARLHEKRNELAELMKDEDVSMENLMFYKKQIVDASLLDTQILQIDEKINNLKSKIKESSVHDEKTKNTKADILNSFLTEMKNAYNFIVPDDPIEINDIFTKANVNFSGCQQSIFLLSRLYAAKKIMKLNFPLYIDDFRDGELSTTKEKVLLDLLKKLDCQVILSCTLKDEEGDKYYNIPDVHSISFDYVEPFHLLNKDYNKKFFDILKKFNIDLNIQ